MRTACRSVIVPRGAVDFIIGAPVREFDQTVYGGWRYPVEARLDNRKFAVFHLDVGIGDAIVSEPEWQTGQDFLSFAGIPPARVAMLPMDQQFSEKIHAYSRPRGERANSRTRDLVDIVLLIEHGLVASKSVRDALKATFERRKTHSIPETLSTPPAAWKLSYQELAEECGVKRKTIDEAFKLLEEFWNRLYK